ncbi:peptidoglycan-binding protein [Streptomyces sp. NPDC001508]|uniref:peptidoglycan-binding protein n=1 Tax=Streptomyces sp. NPDC001508 TaxID=3154656 RepID=UPI00331D38FA
MADPMSAAQLAAALRAEGLTVKERSGWSAHNRAGHGAWGPLNGVMIHHTASGDGTGIVDLCWSGRSDLPGPLCHGVIHKDGTVTLVGWGRANHAGVGDQAALTAVINESTAHPAPGRGTVDGNARFVGFECVNRGDGDDPWPEAQLDAIARASAAVCRFYGWSADSVIGHKEWTNQKVDPRGFTMASMRGRVMKRLGAKPEAPKPSKPTYEPFPGAGFFKAGRRSPAIAAMHKRLVAEGCNRYKSATGQDVWGSGDVASYAVWQRKLGYSGAAADGIPGATSWAKLHVPNV